MPPPRPQQRPLDVHLSTSAVRATRFVAFDTSVQIFLRRAIRSERRLAECAAGLAGGGMEGSAMDDIRQARQPRAAPPAVSRALRSLRFGEHALPMRDRTAATALPATAAARRLVAAVVGSMRPRPPCAVGRPSCSVIRTASRRVQEWASSETPSTARATPCPGGRGWARRERRRRRTAAARPRPVAT